MRQIIKKQQVRVDEAGYAPSPRESRPESEPPAHEVELVRVDGRVHALEVRCSCGEVSVIELTYGEASAPEEMNS